MQNIWIKILSLLLICVRFLFDILNIERKSSKIKTVKFSNDDTRLFKILCQKKNIENSHMQKKIVK